MNQDCLEQFQALKLGKKIRYIIYTLSPDNTEIVVAKTNESTNYDDFLAELPAAECRYAVYDFEYQKGDEGKRNKIVFVTWYVPADDGSAECGANLAGPLMSRR